MSRTRSMLWIAYLAAPCVLAATAGAANKNHDPARAALQSAQLTRARDLLRARPELTRCSTDATACVARAPLQASLLAQAESGLHNAGGAIPIFEALYRSLTARGEDDVAARVAWRIAHLLVDSKQPGDALTWLDQNPAEESLLAASWLKARALRKNGQARAALQHLIALAPEQLDHDDFWRIRLLAEAAQAARASKNPAARMRWLTTLWVDHPKSGARELGIPHLFDGVDKDSLRASAGIEGQVKRVEALLEASALREALAESRALHPKRKDLACRVDYVQGKVLRNQRRYSQALKVLNPLAERCPEQAPRALYLIGRVAAFRGDSKAAMAAFDRLVAGYPKHELADDVLFFAGDQLSLAARWTESNRYFKRVADDYTSGDYHDEAEWRLAFNALRSADRTQAISLLDSMARAHAADRDPRHYQRALYWRARLSLNQDRDGAMDDLEGLLRNDPVSYYGMQARVLIGQIDPARAQRLNRWMLEQAQLLPLSTAKTAALPPPPVADARLGHRLVSLGLDDEAREVLGRIDSGSLDLQGLLAVAADLRLAGDTHAAHWMVRRRAEKELHGRPTVDDVALWRAGFPLGYRQIVTAWAQRRSLDRFLVFGLIREESAFEAPVVSWAGAIGLMQLMPSTAREEAGLDRLSGFELAQLTRPEINIRLGTSHIARRIKLFSGNHALAIAAYNAGPGNVRKWSRQTQETELARYIESIPVEQTRDYTKRVLRSWQVYRYLYAPEAPAVNLPQKALSLSPRR